MKVLYIVIVASFLAACTANPPSNNSKVEPSDSQKITVTGTRIKRSDLPSGPKLKMGLNKENKNSNFIDALAIMKTLPQPKNIGNCIGLISALDSIKSEFTIVNSNKVVLRREHAIYEYEFDDSSCPISKT